MAILLAEALITLAASPNPGLSTCSAGRAEEGVGAEEGLGEVLGGRGGYGGGFGGEMGGDCWESAGICKSCIECANKSRVEHYELLTVLPYVQETQNT